MMALARPAAEALVMGSRTMLAIAGQAFGCDTTVLLDSCAEVSLIGRQFIRELERAKVEFRKHLRRPTTTVVGALSDKKLNVLGELTVPLTLCGTHESGVARKVGTSVTFIVTDSYDGPILLSWPLIKNWEATIQVRAGATTVSFLRWPGVTMSDKTVPGSVWSEVTRVGAQVSREEKVSPFEHKSCLNADVRAMILSHRLFAHGKSTGIEEVTNSHMVRLKTLLQAGRPRIVLMRAVLGSPLMQLLDHAVMMPVLIRDSKGHLCVVVWVGSATQAESWRKQTPVYAAQVRERLLLFLQDAEAADTATTLSAYWDDAFHPDEVAWRQLRQGIPDDVDDDIAYPPETEVKATPVAYTLSSIAEQIKASSVERKRDVARVLLPFAEILGEANTARVRDYHHHIKLTSRTATVKDRRDKYNSENVALIEKECERLQKEGFIREAEQGDSDFVSPPLLVPKKDDKGQLKLKRFCVDYRRLNAITVKDRYNLPSMESCLMLRSGRVFSKIDLRSAFWQIPIAPSDQKKTCFHAGNKTWIWTRMPFGLCNAPSTMQRLIDRCLGDALRSFAIGYLDDIIVYSANEEEHLEHLRVIFERLHKFGLRINPVKCAFFYKEVVFLGHLISHGEIRIDPDKVSGIRDMQPPTNVKTLQRMLGVFGYCRKFILNYASLTAPLTDLLRKEVAWRWGPTQQASLDRLKELLTSGPVLAQPDFGKEFELETDASDFGIGAMLGQRDSEGFLRPVSFISRKLTPAEKNYSTREREGLAIVWAVEKLSPYLWGRKFTVYTDHKSLIWLRTAMVDSGRLTRWVQKLSSFEFDIKYRRGKDNVVADGLSRAPARVLFVSRRGVMRFCESPEGEPVKIHPTKRRKVSEGRARVRAIRRVEAAMDVLSIFPSSFYQQKMYDEVKAPAVLTLGDARTTASPHGRAPQGLTAGASSEPATLLMVPGTSSSVPAMGSSSFGTTVATSSISTATSSMATSSFASPSLSVASTSSAVPASVAIPSSLALPEGPVRPVVAEGAGDRRFHKVPGVPLNPEFYHVPDRDVWIGALNADPEYSKLMRYLTSQELPSDLKERERLKSLRGFFFVEDGLLYYHHSTPEGKEVYLLEVPHCFRRDMIRLYHDHAMHGHRNAEQVRKLILRNYRWAGLHRDCASYVKSCLMCFLAKGPNPRNQGLLCAAGADVGKFEVLHIDFVGPILDGTPRGNKFIFTMKDRGTGYLEAIPCKDQTAETAATILWERWFMRFGIPKAIVSDQGAAFKGDLFDSMKRLLHIELRNTTAYHPQANGLVEREHKNLKAYMRAYCAADDRSWDLKLPSFVFVSNNTMKERLSYPPFFLVHGTYPRLPGLSLDNNLTVRPRDEDVTDMLDSLAKATQLHYEQRRAQQLREKAAYDIAHKDTEFAPNDVVWRYMSRTFSGPQGKFALPWTGPLLVKKRHGDVDYVVRDIYGKESTIHVSQLAKFVAFDRSLMGDAAQDAVAPTFADMMFVSQEFQRELVPSERAPAPARKPAFGSGGPLRPPQPLSGAIFHAVPPGPVAVTAQAAREETKAELPVTRIPSSSSSSSSSSTSSSGSRAHSSAESGGGLAAFQMLDAKPAGPLEDLAPTLPVGLTPKVPIPDDEVLLGQFVLARAPGRPSEEFLYKVIGPGLLAHRWVARNRKESGSKKQFAPLYRDDRMKVYETLTQKQLAKNLPDRSPDLATLSREDILLSLPKLKTGKIPSEAIEKFYASYGRSPLVTWEP